MGLVVAIAHSTEYLLELSIITAAGVVRCGTTPDATLGVNVIDFY